jgi:hypothetical protein
LTEGILVICLECGGESAYRGPDRPLTIATGDDVEHARQMIDVPSEAFNEIRGQLRALVERQSRRLTAKAVRGLAEYCLLEDSESQLISTVVEGVSANWAFHAGRVAEKAGEVAVLLLELPDDYRHGSGGGRSMRHACCDRHGQHWARSFSDLETLFCLGIASGHARWLGDQDIWHAMPLGVPYVCLFVG